MSYCVFSQIRKKEKKKKNGPQAFSFQFRAFPACTYLEMLHSNRILILKELKKKILINTKTVKMWY